MFFAAAFLTTRIGVPDIRVVTERSELRGELLDGRYRVGACIGVGGTGVVFEARRVEDDAVVVVKTMRPVFAYNVDLGRRLRREAEIARTVPHPGIPPVIDEGVLYDGSPYIVMEYARGESLSRFLMRHGVMTEAEVAAVAMRVAGILHTVHGHGYVHRDVKPEHVLLDRTPSGRLEVTLLDFGVCAARTAPADERQRERGRVFGTPPYASPEQACGNPEVDARADVYGLGVVMFEMLAGRVPFSAPNVAALLRRIIREDAPRVGLVAPHVSREMDAVVARAMAREPDDRYPSARALARDLAALVPDRVSIERRLGRMLRVGDEAADRAPTATEVEAA